MLHGLFKTPTATERFYNGAAYKKVLMMSSQKDNPLTRFAAENEWYTPIEYIEAVPDLRPTVMALKNSTFRRAPNEAPAVVAEPTV